MKNRTALRQLPSHCCSLNRLRKLAAQHAGAALPAHTLLSRYRGGKEAGGHPTGAPQSTDTLRRSRPHCRSSVASVDTLVKGFLRGSSTERSTSWRSLTKDSAMQDEAISSARRGPTCLYMVTCRLGGSSRSPSGGDEVRASSVGSRKTSCLPHQRGSEPSESRGGVSQRLTAAPLMEV